MLIEQGGIPIRIGQYRERGSGRAGIRLQVERQSLCFRLRQDGAHVQRTIQLMRMSSGEEASNDQRGTARAVPLRTIRAWPRGCCYPWGVRIRSSLKVPA